MVAWRLYYGDDGTFDDERGSPIEAPPLNVQCIAQRDPEVGRHIIDRFAYYWFENGEWYGGDIFGLFDFLMRSGRVKFGRTISSADFRRIHKKAVEDPDLPRKSGWRRDETK